MILARWHALNEPSFRWTEGFFGSDLFDDDMNHGWFNMTGTQSFLPEKRGGHFFGASLFVGVSF